jgi:hypothetical protein
MKKLFTSTAVAVLAFMVVGTANADPVGKFECSQIGVPSQTPIGDKEGHVISVADYACFGVEGVIKDAVYTGRSAVEMNGTEGKYILAGGVFRAKDGVAAVQLIEGTWAGTMKDGKLTWVKSTGKAEAKLAAGSLSSLKQFKWDAHPTGYNRFAVELTNGASQ